MPPIPPTPDVVLADPGVGGLEPLEPTVLMGLAPPLMPEEEMPIGKAGEVGVLADISIEKLKVTDDVDLEGSEL